MTTYHEPTVNEISVRVGIGNSDNKLTQRQWADFILDARALALEYARQVLGYWFSLADQPWQNAELGWIMPASRLDALRGDLADLAEAYQQDSIALAIVDRTEFVGRDAR